MKKPTHFLLTILLLAGVAFHQSCNPNYEDKYVNTPNDTISVEVNELKLSDELLTVNTTGVLGSASEVKLSFYIGGIINKVFVKEGSYFKKGDTLAQLNLSEINGKVKQAKEALNMQQRERERVRSLYNDSAATLQQLQNINTAYEVAKADYNIAIFNQQHATIIADFNGKVLIQFGEEGELIGPGMPLFYVGNNNNSSWVIRVNLTDKDILKTALGDKALIHFDPYEKPFSARVTKIAEQAELNNSLFEITLTLYPDKRKLKNGFIGKIDLSPSLQDAHFKIPIKAIAEMDKEKAIIYLANGNRVIRKKVQPIKVRDNYFIVARNKLKEGDLLILTRVNRLSSKSIISIDKHVPNLN